MSNLLFTIVAAAVITYVGWLAIQAVSNLDRVASEIARVAK
jgi:hypothetical protein